MKKVDKIYVEGKIDIHFYTTILGFPAERFSIQKEGGRAEVIKAINTKENVMGIIDLDLNSSQKTINDNFVLNNYLEDIFKDLIYIYTHKTRKNYLIALNPDYEKWIFRIAKQNKIKPTQEAELPSSPSELKENYKSPKFVNYIRLLSVNEPIISFKKLISNSLQ